jgi:hypothetical protein
MRSLYIHPSTGQPYSVTDDAIEKPRSTPSSSSRTSFLFFLARARVWINTLH